MKETAVRRMKEQVLYLRFYSKTIICFLCKNKMKKIKVDVMAGFVTIQDGFMSCSMTVLEKRELWSGNYTMGW